LKLEGSRKLFVRGVRNTAASPLKIFQRRPFLHPSAILFGRKLSLYK
jgi:hypothetical protein